MGKDFEALFTVGDGVALDIQRLADGRPIDTILLDLMMWAVCLFVGLARPRRARARECVRISVCGYACVSCVVASCVFPVACPKAHARRACVCRVHCHHRYTQVRRR